MICIFLKRQGRRFREPVSLASVTLFDIFIGDLADDRGRLACDMRLRGVTGTPHGRTPILWDLDKLGNWASRNIVKFMKCKDLHL